MNKRDYDEIIHGHVCKGLLAKPGIDTVEYERYAKRWELTRSSYAVAKNGLSVSVRVAVEYCPFCGKKLPDGSKVVSWNETR